MSQCSSHSILTPASPQPCPPHLSTLLSAEEDSASLCSLEPERVFKREGLFREADKHKTMKRKPLASLKVSSTQTSSALNNKLICPGVPPAPEHGVGALRECLKVLVGRTEGSTSHPLYPGVPIPGDGNHCEQGGGGWWMERENPWILDHCSASVGPQYSIYLQCVRSPDSH